MSLISNTALALSMSADAFAASVSKGVALRKPKFTDALRIGLIFGCIETITPIIGWALGLVASQLIQSIDHWIAFFILATIGFKMIFEGFQKSEEQERESYRLSVLILTAIGTSIDALAVGVTLAFLDTSILITAAMIGAATFVMSTIGIMTGHYIGTKAGRIAEILGGLCLIAIGTKILFEHLGYIAV
ncbi:MAG: manganese efflux pump MntP family protein [Rickettsiales bacterium]|nr:manganese efflux pump MntP family protein [Rickettsiales bacterium]